MTDATNTGVRKAISDPVWKELFSRSGNMCFMDECSSPLFDLNGLKDVFVAHIKGVGKTGPRHDSLLTQQELNSIDNLLLLCNRHHNQIDKMPVTEFTVERVQQIKKTHEDLVRSFSEELQNHVFDHSEEPVDTSSFTFNKWLSFLGFKPTDEMERALESESMRLIVRQVGRLPADTRKVLTVILRHGTVGKNFGENHVSIRIQRLIDLARPTPEGTVLSQLATLQEVRLCDSDDPDFLPDGTTLQVSTRTQGDWDPFTRLKEFCRAEHFDPSELLEKNRWDLLN